MSTLDKQSVRGEFDRLKLELENLSSEKKVPPEYTMLVQSLFVLIELILSIFLERKTTKNSQNSSKPSSQTEKDESALNHPGSNGKGKPETAKTVDHSRTCEHITLSKVSVCDICGEDLENTACSQQERRTKIDIIFEKVVEHVDAEIKQCPTCEATVKGAFPADMPGPLQYGNGLKAYVISLLICQLVSLNRAQKSIKALIGVVIAESTLLKFVLRLHQALEGWEQATIARLLTKPAMHVDETSLRVDKKNYWIHVYSSGDITLKFLHRKRGLEAIESINIIPRYLGDIIHDCWASYISYKHCGHGLCGSHLLRELTFIIDSNGYAWASDMKCLLRETCKKVSKSKRKKLTTRAYDEVEEQYRNILARAEKELPAIPEKTKGKRGKVAKSDAHNLFERLQIHETAVLLFAKKPHVSFTNNRAERDLRMAKVKQKVSGCFRVEIYAHAYCRISSYLQTMANRGHNPLIAIQMALAGEFEFEGCE